MDVSKNGGFSPQIIHFNKVFFSILNHPLWSIIPPIFWKHPYIFYNIDLHPFVEIFVLNLEHPPNPQKKMFSTFPFPTNY